MIEIVSGDSFQVKVSVEKEDGTAKDLTNASIETVLAPREGASPLVTKTTSGGGVTITDATGGVFRADFTPSDTDVSAGRYYLEAEVTDSSGAVDTVLTEPVFVQAGSA